MRIEVLGLVGGNSEQFSPEREAHGIRIRWVKL